MFRFSFNHSQYLYKNPLITRQECVLHHGNILFSSFYLQNQQKICSNKKKDVSLQPQNRNGTLADRLGNGLQNRVEQFDSARYLKSKSLKISMIFRLSDYI